MIEADIKQTLTLIIRRITNESTAVVYRKYLSLFEALTYKLSVLPEPMVDSLDKEINYIYALSDTSFKIERLRNWLYNIFQNQDQVDFIMKDIVPAHLNVYFEDENSNKTCRILSNRIIKECKRLYNNLDEFDIASLSLTLSTITSEGMIKMLKKLKSIGAVKCCETTFSSTNNDVISFEYFINDMINDMLTKC